jgi:hypothetical protein
MAMNADGERSAGMRVSGQRLVEYALVLALIAILANWRAGDHVEQYQLDPQHGWRVDLRCRDGVLRARRCLGAAADATAKTIWATTS